MYKIFLLNIIEKINKRYKKAHERQQKEKKPTIWS